MSVTPLLKLKPNCTKKQGNETCVCVYMCCSTCLSFCCRIKLVVSEDDVRKSYQRAMDSMARLNRTAARLMHKYNAHGSTDITGKLVQPVVDGTFGIKAILMEQ